MSAKYKGAYCEAKVKSVDKQIKVRVSLKGAHGTTGPSLNIRDKDIVSINGDGNLVNNAVIKLKHPDTNDTGINIFHKNQNFSGIDSKISKVFQIKKKKF